MGYQSLSANAVIAIATNSANPMAMMISTRMFIPGTICVSTAVPTTTPVSSRRISEQLNGSFQTRRMLRGQFLNFGNCTRLARITEVPKKASATARASAE